MIFKEIPEDFVVKEINNLELSGNGKYSYYLLRKRCYNTLDALIKLSSILKIDLKNFGYAGNKDKMAITEQYISIRGAKFKEFKIKDIELNLVGKGDKPIQLGQLVGNRFEIVVRDLKTKKGGRLKWIVNYFDEQRFGGDNIDVGKKILSGNFDGLDTVPKTLALLYIHSVQSYIWNKTVETYLKKYSALKMKYNHGSFLFPIDKIRNKKIPIVGYLTKIHDKEIEKIATKIVKMEKIRLSDFIISGYPRLSLEGSLRDVIIRVKRFKLRYEADELHDGRLKCILTFSLPKGSYATLVIKRFFK